ncbi:YciI family protein [Nonomuraea sp. NPDC055795]
MGRRLRGGDGVGAGRAPGVRPLSGRPRSHLHRAGAAPRAGGPHPAADVPAATGGPFTPRRAEFASFYVVECADLDAAEEVARNCPIGAEIRPIWEAP